MSSTNQEPIKLIKCLYNKSTHSPLRLSDKCLHAYKDLYKEEFNYDGGKNYILDPKIIKVVEEVGLEKSSGFGTYLAFQLVPKELKKYFVVEFIEGTKKVYIDYARAFATILHENRSNYEHGYNAHSFLVHKIYKKYNRINYIRSKYDKLMRQTLDKAYEYPFVYTSEAYVSDASSSEEED